MWKIDYHIHTIYSDGGSEPEQIVRTAAAKGIETVAITDHDGIDGVETAIKVGKECGVNVITGIEFATEYGDGDVLHILGYGFDSKNKMLTDILEYINEERNKRNLRLIALLGNMGYEISMEEIRSQRNNDFIGKPNIARMLQAKGYIRDWLDAFKPGEFLESPEAKEIKKTKIDATEAVKVISKAGGIPVLAHPIQIKDEREPDDCAFYDKVDNIVTDLKDKGLRGIECYHPDQDREQTIKFLDLAEKHGLNVSRGTDFHYADYNNPKTTADYIEEGNQNGYGVYPRDFIKL
ncbi:MAG: PHP domain-containing protein [Bacillota bacterium]|nr:PHP domain-containing protein [Bacillota bacterium]